MAEHARVVHGLPSCHWQSAQAERGRFSWAAGYHRGASSSSIVMTLALPAVHFGLSLLLAGWAGKLHLISQVSCYEQSWVKNNCASAALNAKQAHTA